MVTTTDKRLAPGTMLGAYKIVRLIGKGGMGEVYEAHEELLHRRVAIKIITEDAIKDIPGALDLFLQEGKALAQLNHPNVVTIYQLGNDHGTFYIAMEYVDGIDLDTYLEEKNPDFDQCLYIFNKILLGVRALHRSGVIHRDLKPKNIIIQEHGKIKLVDFGIARIISEAKEKEDSRPTHIMGSVHYMAPEVSRGVIPTAQSDIWSLGIIFYQLLKKERPYWGATQTEVLKKVRNQDVKFTTISGLYIPQQYRNIIYKMCNKSLTDRYASIDDILIDLDFDDDDEKNFWSKQTFSNIVTYSAATLVFYLALTSIFKSDKFKNLNTQEPVVQEEVAEANFEPVPQEIIKTKKKEPTPVVAKTLEEPPPSIGADVVEPEKFLKQKTTHPKASTKITTRKKIKKPITRAKFKKRAKRTPASTKSRIITTPPRWVQNQFSFKIKGRNNSFSINWKDLPGIARYKIAIAKDAKMKNVITSKTVTGSSYLFQPTKPGIYYAQVFGLDKRRNPASAPSTVASIQIKKAIALANPVLKAPINNIVVPSQGTMITPIACSWSKISLATNYEFQLSMDSEFKTIALQTTTSKNQHVITSPLQNAKFYWRVRATSPENDPSDWSKPRAFILK